MKDKIKLFFSLLWSKVYYEGIDDPKTAPRIDFATAWKVAFSK